MKCKKIVLSIVTIGFLTHSVMYAEETETTSNDYYSNYGALSLNTNALNTTLGASLQNDIATVAPIAAEKTVAPQSLNLQQPANMVAFDTSAVRNSINQEILATAPTIATPTEIFTDWYGTITFNSENKSNGELRYWGGRFDDSISEQAKGGGPVFNINDGYTLKDGEVKDVYFMHGENSSTDTTKEFQISNNEIVTDPSFYNTNINSLKIKKILPNENTLTVTTTGHYNYTAWGNWSQTGGLKTEYNGASGIEQMALHNNWSAGQITENLPTQGYATYNGVVNGNWYKGSVGNEYGGKINGTMTMKVNFANTSVMNGTLNLKDASTGDAFATATMTQMQIDRANRGFAGRLIGADITTTSMPANQIAGQFNGPNAQEISGNWNVTKQTVAVLGGGTSGGEFASGVFAGKK